MTSPQNDAALQDELTFERLIETIAASKGMSALLVAVSDDPFQEETIVRRCEVELLQQEGIHTVEVQLARRDPSMRAAIERALTTAPHVRAGRPSVLMVRGAGGLSGLNLQAEDDSPTEIDRFFGYLQWTREAIGQIPYPIVLWLTPRLYKQMAKRAPDFWSWRRGTFQFRQRTPVETGPVRSPDFLGQIARDDSDDDSILSDDSDDDSILSLEDLQAAITANTNNRPRLARLWNQLGRRYQRDYNNYPESIVACEQALQIARELDDQYEKAYALNWLGNAYNSLGEYQQAIDFHEQSLEIRRAISDHKGEAGSLGNLGNTYKSLGEYQQSIDFYEQSLAIFCTISDRYGEAYALNNLGNTYKSLGEYQRSIDFYEQSLAIFRTIGDHYGEAYALNGLGNAYLLLGEYQRAIDFHEQSLAIKRAIDNRHGEAASLGNLGNAYLYLGEYQRAIDFHEQSLAIFRTIGDRQGEANSLNNLGNAYHSLGEHQRAIDFHEQSLAIKWAIGYRQGEANSLANKGTYLAKLGKKWEAKQYYEAARQIYQELGLQYRVHDVNDRLRTLL